MLRKFLVSVLLVAGILLLTPGQSVQAAIESVVITHDDMHWDIYLHVSEPTTLECQIRLSGFESYEVDYIDWNFSVSNASSFHVAEGQIADVGDINANGYCDGTPINVELSPWTPRGWMLTVHVVPPQTPPEVPLAPTVPVVVGQQPHLNDACLGTVYPAQVFLQGNVGENQATDYSMEAFTGIFVYGTSSNLLAGVSREQIQNRGLLETIPQQNEILAESNGVIISRLNTGEYQINVYPQVPEDNTMDVCILNIGRASGFVRNEWKLLDVPTPTPT